MREHGKQSTQGGGEKTNKKILSNSIESYFKHCINSTLFQLKLDKEVQVRNEEEVREILSKRAEAVISDIEVTIDKLLGGV